MLGLFDPAVLDIAPGADTGFSPKESGKVGTRQPDMRGNLGDVQILRKVPGDVVHGPHDPLVHRSLFVFGIDGVAPQKDLLEEIHHHLVAKFPCGSAGRHALVEELADGALQF